MKKTPLRRKTPMKRVGFKKKPVPIMDRPFPWEYTPRKKPLSQLKRKRIRTVSKKRQKENKEYTRLRKEFLVENPLCLPCLERYDMHKHNSGVGRPTIGAASEVHHKARRGKFLLRVDTWLPVCRQCHKEIEENGEWAREMGYTYSPEQRRLL